MFGQGFNSGFLGKPKCFTDTTDIFKDNSGIALYTLDYDASAADPGGKFGEAAKFNNTNSYIELPSTIDDPMRSGSAFTVSLWYKHATQTNSYGGAIMKLLNDIYNLIDVETNGTIRARVLSSSSVTSEVTSSALTVGQWYHIVWTGNTASGVSLYIDNSLIGNSAWDGTFLTYTNSNYKYNRLGYQNQSVSSLVGEIDQVRFFNRLVTSTEVSTLYNESNETTDTLQILGDSSCYAAYTLNNNVNDLSGNYNATSSNLVYTNKNGTPSNVDFGVGGKSLYGARFNGSNSRIDLPTGSLGFSTNNFSVSCWFNSADITQDNQSLFWFQHNQSPVRFGAQLSQPSFGGDNDLRFFCTIAGTGTNLFTNSNILSSNTWYHAVFVKSSTSGMTIYINGSSVATNSATGAVNNNVTSGGTNTIGAYQTTASSGYFNGSIDQFRMFNKALSSSEISKLYGNGAGEIACEYTATTTDINYPVANSAYYKLDNNSKALGGNNTGKFNQGARFVGSSTGIGNSTLQLSSTAHSVSLWIKPEDLTASKWHIAFFSAFNGKPTCTIGKRPDRTTSFHYRNESSQEVYFTLSTANIWYHIVVTRNNSGSTVYVNGSSVATDSNSMGSYTWAGYQKTVIGSNPLYPAEYWSGTIDQVRVYDVVLTATDVSNLYNNETVSTANTLSFPTGKTAIATYKLDGDGADISGNHSGVEGSNIKYDYSGTDTNVEYGFGRYGQAAVFNGSNSKITLSSTISGIKTYSFWINPNSSGNATYARRLFGDVGGTSYTNSITFDKPQSKVIYYEGTSARSSDTISNDTWSHIAFTSSGSTLKVYTNGSLSNTYTTSAFVSSIDEICSTTSNRQFNGLIDQVRIFNSELSSANITSLYNEKPETDTSNFKTVLYKGNSSHNYISNVGMDLETSGGLVWMKDRENSYSNTLYDSVRGTGTGKAIFSDSNVEEGDRTDIHNFVSFDANGFTLGATSHANNIINKSGYDLVAWNWKGGGLLNRSASFNGSSSYISTSLYQGRVGSFSFWMKRDSTPSSSEMLVAYNGSSSGLKGFFAQLQTDGDIRLALNKGTSGTNGLSIYSSGVNTSDGSWHHVAVAWDITTQGSTNSYLYIDGSLNVSGTADDGNWTSGNSSGTYIFGSGTTSNSQVFEGSLDQVRIFNKKISSSEVTSLYNETSSTINTLQVLGDTSCVAAYPLGAGAGDLSNTYSGIPANVTFNNPGHLTRNTSGTIESTVSANQDAGFSIVKYTGNGTAGATVAHGLGTKPQFILFKNLDTVVSWIAYDTINNVIGYLDNTDSLTDGRRAWAVNNTDPTNTLVTLGNNQATNASSDFIMYCWHSVAGYSRIGSYSGSGVSGKEVTLDFNPSFVMIKRTDATTGWVIVDDKRGTKELYPNVSNQEDTSTTNIVLGTNKFTLNSTGSWYNASGGTYLYMAFK